MLINVFGNSSSSYDNGTKIDTSLFVQKLYLSSNYIESNIAEHIDLNNQYRIKNLLDPVSIRQTESKKFCYILFNDPSIVKNTTYFNFNNKNHDNVHSIEVNSIPNLE